MSSASAPFGRPRPRVGITLGDINGIGPEVLLKAIWDSALRARADLVAIGSAHALQTHATALRVHDLALRSIQDVDAIDQSGALHVLDLTAGRRPPVEWGRESEMAGQLAMQAVEVALDLCVQGRLDAMVTAPISKKAISMAGYAFPGHTEFIADRTKAESHAMMLVSGPFRVALATAHVPLRDVPEALTEGLLLDRLRVIDRSLRRDMGVGRPRIAVLGLNPHSGDGGVLGSEETEIIRPAVVSAKEEGLLAFGPFPADGFFGQGLHGRYDAVLAMYHDQGLAPFKALAFGTGVNYTAGLPIVRTSPDHGTAFDIAGQGNADPSSMREAIYLAIDIVRRRLDAEAAAPAEPEQPGP